MHGKLAHPVEPSLCSSKVSIGGNEFSRAERKAPKQGPRIQSANCRDRAAARKAANSGAFASFREISANVGLPRGPGRILTSSETVMGSSSFALEQLPELTAITRDAF